MISWPPKLAVHRWSRERIKAVAASAVLALAGIILAFQFLWRGPGDATLSRQRDLIDAKTGKIFLNFLVPEKGRFPYTNPSTGEATLFPAEKCYYSRDGSVKLAPTYVLLNAHIGKPGDTICPDCGRRVVAHNPMPTDDVIKLMNDQK